jgi:hypothetical protein
MIYEIIFRVAAYIAFGLVMEIIFTAASQIVDGKITDIDKQMMGTVSLWMIPIYASIVLLYEPIFYVMTYFDVWLPIRFIVWAVLISGVEACTGYAYDKFLNLRPWDYSMCWDKVFRNGYTRYFFVPLWGIVGLILELYTQILHSLSPYIGFAVKSIKFIW